MDKWAFCIVVADSASTNKRVSRLISSELSVWKNLLAIHVPCWLHTLSNNVWSHCLKMKFIFSSACLCFNCHASAKMPLNIVWTRYLAETSSKAQESFFYSNIHQFIILALHLHLLRTVHVLQRRDLPDLLKHCDWKLSDAILVTDKGPDNVDTHTMCVLVLGFHFYFIKC